MMLEHIKGITFYGLLFDIYKDKETGRNYLKVESECGGDIVFVELKDEGKGGESAWLIE